MTSPILLSLVIPSKTRTDPMLLRLLESIRQQKFPDDQYEILVVTEGNSEQAKAIGIQRAKGQVIGFFCSDNMLRSRHFLNAMYYYANLPGVTGAYSARYDWVPTDKPLSRYFALLGANDPLCWFLGKADRKDYLSWPSPICGERSFREGIPSIGDNGFFVKKAALEKVSINPNTHFPMDLCEDLRRAGEYKYYVVHMEIWHRTGESWFDYFRRRYVYTRDLYFKQWGKRRWHMVEKRDYAKVLLFAGMSLCGLPHVWTAIRGFRRVRDWAWFLHPIVCFLLVFLYGWCFLRWGLKSVWSSARSTGQTPCAAVLKA